MRNKIFGAIGVIWGGLVLLNAFFGGMAKDADPGFRTGQLAGVAFGFLLFASGLYYLLKGDGGGPRKKKKKKRTPAIRTPI